MIETGSEQLDSAAETEHIKGVQNRDLRNK